MKSFILGMAALSPPAAGNVDLRVHPIPGERYFANIRQLTDGTGLEQVTFSNTFDGYPMFSRNGSRLAFASTGAAPNPVRQTSSLWTGSHDGYAGGH